MGAQQLDDVAAHGVRSNRGARDVRAKRTVFSPARLERMRAIMATHVDGRELSGLVHLVCRRGEEHGEAIGTLAFDSRAPMQEDTIFRLASTTKPITAVATMLLLEECKLRLDDPVDPWLPELANRRVLRAIDAPLDDTVPASRPITVRDLLTFRAGYGEIFFAAPGAPLQIALAEARLPLAVWPFPDSADELMKRLGALPLAHQPGERWLYHMSAEILGVLVARASGKPFATFLRERLFEPLGMNDTGFHVPEAKLDRLATCYVADPITRQVSTSDTPRGGLYARPPVFESGAGGLVSTAPDLLAFGKMLLADGIHGRERILSRASIELMTSDQLTPEQKAHSPFFPAFWDSNGWGLGLGVVTRRGDLGRGPGSFGWDGAFGTSLWIDPHEELVGVLMTQCRPPVLGSAPVVQDFWTSTYAAFAE